MVYGGQTSYINMKVLRFVVDENMQFLYEVMCHCRSNLLIANVWPHAIAMGISSLSACTVDTSMITVSSCGVKLQ